MAESRAALERMKAAHPDGRPPDDVLIILKEQRRARARRQATPKPDRRR